MKSIYTIAFFLCLGSFVQAQSPISACNRADGGIEIAFDYSLNCPNAPGDLSGLAEIGFHSGADMWSAVVDWDAADAVTGVNDGNDLFTVTLEDPAAYYGAAPSENIYFVFNQGPETPDTPWDSEGKDDDGAGGCADFFVVLADITEDCEAVNSVADLKLDNEITVSPNPFIETAYITINNAEGEVFDITVTNLAGQAVRMINGFNGEQLELERGNLVSGMYFITFRNAEGKFATEKVVVR